MITLQQLSDIKAKTQQSESMTPARDKTRVVVGMATCGISAVARPVLESIKDEIAKRNLTDVLVFQTGCIGACIREPMIEVSVPGEEKVTYVNVTAEMIPKIVSEHFVNGSVVTEYTIGYADQNK